MANETYKLNELCDMARVTRRTVYFYIQKGLIKAPATPRGRGARYDRSHLRRLELIRRLQETEHLPLAVIRERLAALSDAQIARHVESPALAPAPSDKAPAIGPTRSQWDRIVLARDVELHVRRPLSRERDKRVQRLLEEAGRIMKDRLR